jgi:hypothetical protein
MILGEGEETIDDLLNTTGPQQRSPEFIATGAKPSIPVDLWGVNGDKAPNLSSLSLKKVRKKALDRVVSKKRAGIEAKLRKSSISVTRPFFTK